MTDVFTSADGDAWFARNKAALETAAEHDWPLRLIERNGLKPQRVLEVGCANGWRLAEIKRRWGSKVGGCDISDDAIANGRQRYPEVNLRKGVVSSIPFPLKSADLTICYFVLHWVDRSILLMAINGIDWRITNGGHLILGDFYPDELTKTPYHHREGLWTYKADYAAILLATGLYRLIDRVIFDHDTGKEGDWWGIDGRRRAVVSLLKKGDWYREAGR